MNDDSANCQRLESNKIYDETLLMDKDMRMVSIGIGSQTFIYS